MAKKKKEPAVEAEIKPFEITGGKIADDFCDYTFEIKTGVGAGDKHTVKGSGVIDQDMHVAFRKFNAHLAAIDDVFKHSEVDVENIDEMHNNELTALYYVTEFKMKGSGDNESIILKGTKHITSTGGRIALETPKIPLDKLSSYKWHAELKAAADDARNEVELYKNGKCTEKEAEVVNPKQMKISDEAAQVEFDNAEV